MATAVSESAVQVVVVAAAPAVAPGAAGAAAPTADTGAAEAADTAAKTPEMARESALVRVTVRGIITQAHRSRK